MRKYLRSLRMIFFFKPFPWNNNFTIIIKHVMGAPGTYLLGDIILIHIKGLFT